MSLQKAHKKGHMSHGAERKMNLSEFNNLVNSAYSFLKIELETTIAEQTFNNIDVDKDSLITYGQYFQFIIKYVCRPANYKVSWSKDPPKDEAITPNQGT